MSTADEIDTAVKAVAQQIRFTTTLDADMGADVTPVLQIDLGRRGGPDWPADRAGIDADEPDATWWFDVEGGRETIISDLTLDASPAEVAVWIETQAELHGSPAWVNAQRDLAQSGAAAAPTSAPATAPTVAPQQPHYNYLSRYENTIEF